jgi:hypothetical protein
LVEICQNCQNLLVTRNFEIKGINCQTRKINCIFKFINEVSKWCTWSWDWVLWGKHTIGSGGLAEGGINESMGVKPNFKDCLLQVKIL